MLSLCCVCTGASKHHPNIWGHPNIWRCPSIQGASKHRGEPKHMVPKHTGKHMGASKDTGSHPNTRGIQTHGVSNIQGAFKCMEAYGHPLSLTKHAFFVLCMHRGHPNIFCIILNYICLLVFFFNFKYFIHF